MADITIVNGVYKPTYNWGAPSCGVQWEQIARKIGTNSLTEKLYSYTAETLLWLEPQEDSSPMEIQISFNRNID